MSEGIVQIGVRLPLTLKKHLDEAVVNDTHLNVSDFVRDAIREKLRRDGFLKRGDLNT